MAGQELGALIVCLAISLLCPLFLTHYGHYYWNREYAEAAGTKYETEANEIQHLNVENIRTPAELDAFIGPRRNAASISGQNAKWNERREKLYFRAWVWGGRLARLLFFVGLVLLFLFATKNV